MLKQTVGIKRLVARGTKSEVSRKFTNGCLDNQNTVGQPRRQDQTQSSSVAHSTSTQEKLPCSYWRQHRSSHRIIFVGMTSGLAVSSSSQPSDEVNFQNATVFRDYAGPFRPGYWIFVRPSLRKYLAVRQVGHTRQSRRELGCDDFPAGSNIHVKQTRRLSV